MSRNMSMKVYYIDLTARWRRTQRKDTEYCSLHVLKSIIHAAISIYKSPRFTFLEDYLGVKNIHFKSFNCEKYLIHLFVAEVKPGAADRHL